jgi:hypothetical protein
MLGKKSLKKWSLAFAYSHQRLVKRRLDPLPRCPGFAVKGEIERGELKILPWAGPRLETAVLMLHHKEKWLSPPLAAFMELVREEFGIPPMGAHSISVAGGRGKRCC